MRPGSPGEPQSADIGDRLARPVEASSNAPVRAPFEAPSAAVFPVGALPVDAGAAPGASDRLGASDRPGASDRIVGDVVRLLAAVIGRLRPLLLSLVIAPLVAAAALVTVTLRSGGLELALALMLAVAGVAPAVWLDVRRRQLGRALRPPQVAAAEIAQFARSEIWNLLRTNLLQITASGGGVSPRALARRVWRGVKLGGALQVRLAGAGRFAPFLPGRLRGLALLCGWCGVSCVVLAGLTVVELLTLPLLNR